MYFDLGDMEQTICFWLISMGTVAVIMYNFCQFKYKKQFLGRATKKIIKRKAAKYPNLPLENIATAIELIIIIGLFYYTGGPTNILFGKCLDMSENYFGTIYFSPVLLVIGCYLLGLDVEKVFDMIAPSYALGLIFAKIGCFIAGCCHGIEWEHGLYNFDHEAYEVPIQLVEIFWAVMMFAVLLALRKKFKPGTGFPLYLILYSSTRFCSEFFRYEPDVFLNLKLYHLLCISGVIIGIILYIVALKFSDKITLAFTDNNLWLNRKEKNRKSVVHHKKRK